MLAYFLRPVNRKIGGDKLIATKIANLCKAKGVAISEVERTVGLSNGLIRKWDDISPRVDSLKKVADYFGIKVDDLLKE